MDRASSIVSVQSLKGSRTDLIGKQSRIVFVFFGCHFERGVRMVLLPDNKQILVDRLEAKGLEKDTIPSFIRSMRICIATDPKMNHLKANKQLQFLGWNDIEVDYHTLQLSIAYFEAEQ